MMQSDRPIPSPEQTPRDETRVRAIAIAGIVDDIWVHTALALARPGTRLALIHGPNETDPAIQTAARAAASGAMALPLLCPADDAFSGVLDRAIEDLGRLDAVVFASETPAGWPAVAADRLRQARPCGRLIVARVAETSAVQTWLDGIVESAKDKTTSRVRSVGAAATDPETLGQTVARAFETIPERGAVLTP